MTLADNPKRNDVPAADTWDLTSLFPSDAAWETALTEFESLIAGFESFRGKLGQSAEMIAKCLEFDCKVDQLSEKIGVYASLKTSEDQGNSHYQGYMARYYSVATKAGQAASFIRPEILAIPQQTIESYLASSELASYRLVVERINRFRAHTLSESEEKLLAMQGEMAQTASKVFRQLNDADLKFGKLTNEKGIEVDLTNASFSSFLVSPVARLGSLHFISIIRSLHRMKIRWQPRSRGVCIPTCTTRELVTMRVHENRLSLRIMYQSVSMTILLRLFASIYPQCIDTLICDVERWG